MKLYLIRHGEAVSSIEDPERPLSNIGQQNIERLGQCLAKTAMPIDYIWHSPKQRAVQTAQTIANYTKPNFISTHDELLPNDDIEGTINLIQACRANTMIVGHLPFLGELASALTRSTFFQFQPGSCLCLEGARDIWSIEYFFNSDVSL